MTTWRRRQSPWLLWAAVLCGGCASSGSYGGIWRGEALVAGPANALLYAKDGGTIGVELVLGEYGPDLSGVVRFYRGGNFVRARAASAPDLECACSFVHEGRATAQQAAFTLKGCLPGGSTAVAVRTRATLTAHTDGAELVLRVDDPSSPLDGLSTTVVVQQQGLASEISDADLACSPAGSGGNPASGR